MSVIRLLFEQIALKKRAISWKKRIFLLFLTVIPPFFAQEQIASVTLRSVACFLRATGVICSQRSLKKSYNMWANHSRHSLQKIRSRRSWQKSHGSNSLFFTSKSLFRSQKTSNSLKKPMSKFLTLGSGGEVGRAVESCAGNTQSESWTIYVK